MNPAITLLAAAAVAAATTFTVLMVRERPSDAPAFDVTAQARQLDELKKADEGLAAMLRRLEERLTAPSAPARSEVPAVSDAAIDAALERRLARLAPDAVAKLDGAAAHRNGQDAFDVAAAVAQLTSAGNDVASEAVWRKAREAKKLDELVAAFEQRAKANPGVADAHVDLANAYLQRLFAGTMGPEAGIWGTKADKAFDAALELDPEHWEARFSKAVSLANWPDFLGRKPDAVKHLEILVEQQERKPLRPEHAQTDLILANLYQQQNKEDKANALVQKGLTHFPDNAELRKRAGR